MKNGEGRVASRKWREWAAAALLLLASLTPSAWGDMTDPTRPPPGFSVQGTVQVAEPPLLVTSVFLMDKRPYALVDGVTVRVGDRLGDGRVNRIEEQGVWLKTRAGKRLLKLVPGIDKKPVHQGKTRMEKTK
jgi:hypothetical protein